MEPRGFEQSDTHLKDHLRAIWRRKWLVILVTAGVFSVWMWRALREPPVYDSMATILLGGSKTAGVVGVGAFAADTGRVESEMAILRSRMIAELTAVRLQRHFALQPLPPGVSLRIAGVGITEAGRPGVYTVTFTDATGQYQVTDPGGRLIGVGRSGQAFVAGGISFTISDVTAKPGDTVRILLRMPATAAEGLRGGLTVSLIGGTNIINVKVRASDPQEVARVANAFAETYMDFNRQERGQQVFNTRQFLDEQLGTLHGELVRSERALTEYKASAGVIQPNTLIEMQAAKTRGAEIEIEKLVLQRREAEAILAPLRRGSAQGFERPVISLGDKDSAVGGLTGRLSDLEIRRARLRRTYTARHRLIVELEQEIEEVRNELAEQLQATINGLKVRERLLAQKVHQDKAELAGLPPSELRFLELSRDAGVKGGIYTYLLQKQQDARVAEASERGGARIIDRALVPTVPISPNVPRKAGTGAAVSLFIGVGLAFLLNYLDRSVKNVKDLEARTGLPAFGVIPEICEASPRGLARLQRQRRRLPGTRKLITKMDSRTPAAEAYRALRTNMQFALPGPRGGVFLVTSAAPREGKSLTVANLGIVLAQLGGRILIVDADLRRPGQHHLFRCEGEGGITDVLARNLAWREVVRPTGVENLDLIPAGQTPPNPAELLVRQQMKLFLEEATQHYDLILVDSPPVILFTDACVLAPLVDGVFLVVRAGVTNPEAIARVQSLLGAVKARMTGAILNAVPSTDGLGPGRDGYARYYAYGATDTQPPGEEDGGGWMRRIARRIPQRKRR